MYSAILTWCLCLQNIKSIKNQIQVQFGYVYTIYRILLTKQRNSSISEISMLFFKKEVEMRFFNKFNIFEK